MNTMEIIKGIVKTTSGIGAAAIARNACENFTPKDMHIAIKAIYKLGAMGIGCAVVAAMDAYWDELFDEIEELIKVCKSSDDPESKEIKKELKKMKKELKKMAKEEKKNSKKSDKNKDGIEAEFEIIEEA